MAAASAASAKADQVERVTTVEDLAVVYAHLTHSDAYQDMIFAERVCYTMPINGPGSILEHLC